VTPEERFERIEAYLERSSIESDGRFKRMETWLERMETWLDNSIVRAEIDRQAHEVRIRKVEDLKVELLESQNAAFRAIERLESLVEKTIRGRGPNGYEGI
jgi:hypothetical protein